MLKELVLKGWLDVHRKKRHGEFLAQLILLFVYMALFGVMFGFWGSVGILIIIVAVRSNDFSIQPETHFSLTQAGRQKLLHIGPNASLLVLALRTIAFARPERVDHCTNKRWRKHLSGYYPDNAAFHSNFLLLALEKQGLIESRNNLTPRRTPAGDAALAKAEAEIELGNELPRLLREGSPQVVILAAQLGSLLLLVPDMEGYFHSLINTAGFHDSDNGDNWETKADFLDGDIGSGIGAESGCGVGNDNSDGDWVEPGKEGGCGD
ncbi:MAG: hypothetical protein ACKVUS_10320 [Saprospiraceae bacterium]